MGADTEAKLIELFTKKMDSMQDQFDNERKTMRKTMNTFLAIFGVAILAFVFSSGIIVNKVNSLESNYYKVADKVDILYMVAVRNGDIEFSTRGVEKSGE